MTAPLERSRLEWFGTRSRKPIPRDVHSSSIAAAQAECQIMRTLPICVLLQHTVIAMQTFSRHDVRLDQGEQRRQYRRAGADPIRERGDTHDRR
jgi:hypothetical protein